MNAFPYVKMTQDDAKWKHPDLRKVRRVGGNGAVVDVPVGYGDAPNAQHPYPAQDSRVAETNGHVDEETDSGGVPVEVQWGDVVELWEYDPHPVHGTRPSSLASSLVVRAHTREGVHSDLIEGSTPWTSRADCARLAGGVGDPGDGDEDRTGCATKAAPLPRWTRRRKRKRDGDDQTADDEEVTVASRFASHFHYVMMRCAARKADGKMMTPEEVAEELGLADNHWAGDHSGCGQSGRISRCVTEGWGIETAIYEKGSETHKAVQDWLAKRCGPDKVKSLVHGAPSSINESFHSIILKYAPKRIRFQGSFEARVALAVLHWNNSMDRLVTAYRTRQRQVTRIRRGNKDRTLGAMDWSWLDGIMESWLKS
ncbi:unnamed protein product [Closterium sp. Yama58-4]|nr:unnamed protein product [Closterium sp. Yama58-4]CAI5459646.1 unnamed protein product [Closterium sp. Yama58-4]CAI5459647.1 unnamed protein product [Closterium sp. Yama58-4]